MEIIILEDKKFQINNFMDWGMEIMSILLENIILYTLKRQNI